MVLKAAVRYKVPPPIVVSVIWYESNYHPNLVSSAGALGLMQVMPMHFKRGEKWNDPLTNINVGCRVLQEYHNLFEDWHKTLTAYCFGPMRVSRGAWRSRYSEAVLRTAYQR